MFVWTTPTGHRYTIEPEPLPVGHWPSPTITDEHTPITELIDLIDLIDLDDPDPPLWETTATDTLPMSTGHELLRRSDTHTLTTGPAP